MMKNFTKLFFLILIGIYVLASCSIAGNFILHNASSTQIVLSLASKDYEPATYVIEIGKSANIRFNFNITNIILVKIDESSRCYKIQELIKEWVETTFSGPKVYVKFTNDGMIYVYPKNSDGDLFYKNEPPMQPEGYPLKPYGC